MAYPEILVAATDYAGIRSLLGVTDSEFDNMFLAQPIYGPAIELDIRDRLGAALYALRIVDLDMVLRLRIVAMDWTAAAVAYTAAKGGTLGYVRPTDDTRDWDKLARELRAAGEVWFARVLDPDGPDKQVIFNVPMLRVGGPTRARYRGGTVPPWWKYPPVVGVPPDWPAGY